MRARGYQQLPTKEPDVPTKQQGSHASEDVPSKQAAKKPFKMSDYKLESETYDILISKPPVGSICVAVFLTLLGIACFVSAWLHITQRILGKEQAEIGFTILGLLTFIPGFFHVRIAYYAWQGRPGFTWDMIPS
mmetsp:Transcript_16100/g.27673  ORF Transcript_16100/g.27673 Transcript_16100/m.27673 type:complete len:134 (+) Transcript_16100:135-536(+)